MHGGCCSDFLWNCLWLFRELLVICSLCQWTGESSVHGQSYSLDKRWKVVPGAVVDRWHCDTSSCICLDARGPSPSCPSHGLTSPSTSVFSPIFICMYVCMAFLVPSLSSAITHHFFLFFSFLFLFFFLVQNPIHCTKQDTQLVQDNVTKQLACKLSCVQR